MVPPTRSNPFRTPSPEPLNGKEASTRRKNRYYNAYFHNPNKLSQRVLAKKYSITESCGRNWLEQYKQFGKEARRRLRPRSQVLGRKSRVTKAMCQTLVSLAKNPLRTYPYAAQIEHFKIPISERQLEQKIKEFTHRSRRYVMTYVGKVFSEKNRRARTQYGNDHIYKPLFSFFDHIVYTDKAHVNPTSQARKHITRELGTRDDPENINERPPLSGVRFHITAWISWWGKAEKLEFYNDEEDTIEQPKYPSRPRHRPTTETKVEFQQRVKE